MENAGTNESKRTQSVAMEDRKRCTVSGVSDLIRFDDSEVLLQTDLGRLTIEGGELAVKSLDLKSGTAVVTGRVDGLFYAETAPEETSKNAFFSKLFR